MESRVRETRFTDLEHCDFIKIVLMLCVVLGHSVFLWSIYGWFNQPPVERSLLLQWIAEWFASFHIYAFTLVSGYIFSHIKHEKGGYKEFRDFAIKKAKRLLLPYIIFVIFWAIPWQLVFFDKDIIDIWKRFVFGTAPAQMWFLLMLFIVFIMAFFLDKITYENMLVGSIVSIFLYLIGILGDRHFANIWQIWTACKYYWFFYIGTQLWRHRGSILPKIPSLLILGVDIGIFTLTFLMMKSGGGGIRKLPNSLHILLGQ